MEQAIDAKTTQIHAPLSPARPHFPFSIFHFPCRRSRRSRGAFTVIELLVVIGIIALLGALLVMGIGHMIRHGKQDATNTDLTNIRGMFDEVHAVTPTPTPPVEWLWRNLSVAAPAPAPLATIPAFATVSGLPFWENPIDTSDPRGPTPAYPPIRDCLDAPPGALTADNSVLRNGSRIVLNTQLAMRVLLSYKTNKDAFTQLPADRWMIPQWVYGPIIHPGIDGILGTPDDPTDSVTSVIYVKNNCVSDLDRSVNPPVLRTYRCILEHVPSPLVEPYMDVTNNPPHWVVDPNPTPVLLDAWGNPIIFVPASGLINVYGNVNPNAPLRGVPVTVNGMLYTVQPDPNDTVAALPNQIGTVPTGGRFIGPIQSPDKRPFFVSGGPDGDISTGDDNMYSFEK